MAFHEYDAAEFIETIEDVIEYLNVVAEEEDLGAFFDALGTVARSEGMMQIAKISEVCLGKRKTAYGYK